MKTPIEVLINTFEILEERGVENTQLDIDYVIRVLKTGLDYEREYIRHIKKDKRMTEKDLIELGFERNDISAEESGYPTDWYYYTYEFTKGLCLISCDNEEAEKRGPENWYVEFFETETPIRFTGVDQVFELISIIKNAIVK